MKKEDREDFISYGGRGNRDCQRFQPASLTEDHFKCLMFLCSLQSPEDASILLRLLNKIEENDVSITKLVAKCNPLLILKHDTEMVESINATDSATLGLNTNPALPMTRYQPAPTNWPERKPITSCWLFGAGSFTGNPVVLQGKFKCIYRFNSKPLFGMCYVSNSDSSYLFGAEWIEKLGLFDLPFNKVQDEPAARRSRGPSASSYPLPLLEDIFSTLNGGTVFSYIDFSDDYLKIELSEEFKELVTISTHRGPYRYNQLPFGVKAAPGIFQQLMDSMISGLSGSVVYLGEVVVGKNEAEHQKNLETLFSRIFDFDFHLRFEKYRFAMAQISYRGCILNRYGRRPYPARTEVIFNMPESTGLPPAAVFPQFCQLLQCLH
ncbi:unnamed protein product [Soboliphyme baturini]|uniref:Reverse transcriptase domain-containing protein n=1 Tax=Soboliphyme baturini TaxID=241478 RepID=A0A183J0G3_9BILA|nr:unnamed protein product [Soboliphyme baturini]